MPEPVALQIKTPDTLNTLKSIADFANTALSVKRGGIQLQRETQANNERVALQKFMSVPDNFQTDGAIDLEKVNKAIPAIAPMTGADAISKLTTLATAQTTSKSAKLSLANDRRAAVSGPYGVLGRAGVEDPKAYIAAGEDLKKQFPDDPDVARLVDSYNTIITNLPPGSHLARGAIIASQSILNPAQQQSALSPQAGTVDTGGGIQPVVTTPSVAGQVPSVAAAGAPIARTLPPTTTTVNEKGQPVYLGQPSSGGTRQVPAGNPPGFEASAQGSAATANQDWEATVKGGQYASTNIANLQNIKRFAKDASTGVGSERRSIIAGIAGYLHMDQGEMTKTSTDLLAKNSNMLALAGGDTNLAKTLAEMANPNQHMTKEAIAEAANQVVSIHKLALAKQKYLAPIKALNDPASYNKALSEFNANADPRWLQWSEMSQRERQDMKASMSPTEQAEFRRKGQRLQELGILR
jgi:hypothetical protein